jgi:hypothetical protein
MPDDKSGWRRTEKDSDSSTSANFSHHQRTPVRRLRTCRVNVAIKARRWFSITAITQGAISAVVSSGTSYVSKSLVETQLALKFAVVPGANRERQSGSDREGRNLAVARFCYCVNHPTITWF